MESLKIKELKGSMVTNLSDDPDYPGIYVEFISDKDKGQLDSRPGIKLEYCKESKELRCIIWDDTGEDCEIITIPYKNYIKNLKK